MHCPFCQMEDTKVIDSRLVSNGNETRRRRECPRCKERFTTYEVAALLMPKIIKRDGKRSAFDEEKLRSGIAKALEKRPVSEEAVESAILRIKKKLSMQGDREVSSEQLGQWVMQEIKGLDTVAYVRFASVYCSFEGVDAFRETLDKLEPQE